MKKINALKKHSVLIIGPGERVKGGITSVITRYKNNNIWDKYNIEWLESYDDKNNASKIKAFLKALIISPRYISSKSIIHIHLASDVSFYRKLVFFIIAKILKKRIIIHIHAADPKLYIKGIQSIIAQVIFNYTDKVIVLSEYWKRIILKINNKTNVMVLNNPAKIQYSNNHHRVNIDKRYILYVGKIEDRKGYSDLINAMPIINSEMNDVKLVFAGHGDIEKGKHLANRINMKMSIVFLGWIDGKEKERLFDNASVFCLPSYNEGVPMAMLEAMSYGIPVIVTNVGGIPDIITNHNNGIIVNPGNIEDLAKSIIQVLKDEKLSYKLSYNGMRTVNYICNDSSVTQKLSNVYDQLLN